LGCSPSKFDGGGGDELNELCDYANYVPVIITHFFNKPIQNSELLRKLYLEKDLSSYEISKLTGWPRSSISDAIRALRIKKDELKSPSLRFGEKLSGATQVVHKGEQKTINKMIELREQGQSFKKISEYLNDNNIPTKLGGSWYPSTVKSIVKRELKKREA
jgi:predicted DNA-binding protein YlxM (UPF0122 family)|tara:strand:+ start:259 stop:741 length:483 start_codon:yes stop_codon:yes gene_type:complete